MITKSDICILVAALLSFVLGAYLFFAGNHDQGLFVATWVIAILGFGIYFKLMTWKR